MAVPGKPVSISEPMTHEMLSETRPCTVCDTPTDTRLGIDGGTEWFVACLMAMGMPMREAKALVIYMTNITSNYGTSAKLFANVKPFQARAAPSRRHILVICPQCGDKAHMAPVAGSEVPCYTQPA
jgi:hypothetical protein